MEEKKFKLDEKWVDMPKGVETFGALLGWVIQQMKDRDRVLLGVLHGEVSVNHEELGAWEMRPIGEFDELEFLSADSRELARHTCSDMVAFMDKLGQGMDRALKLYESGEKEMVPAVFSECMEGWGMVIQAYWNLILLGDIDASVIEIDGRTLSEVISDLKDVYTKLAGDYGKGDMKAVKDSFADELVLYLAPMRDAFEHLQEKMAEPAV